MTRKDYIKIAEVLRNKLGYILKGYGEYGGKTIVNDVINGFMDMLQADNPRFDRETFINYINK